MVSELEGSNICRGAHPQRYCQSLRRHRLRHHERETKAFEKRREGDIQRLEAVVRSVVQHLRERAQSGFLGLSTASRAGTGLLLAAGESGMSTKATRIMTKAANFV